MKIVKLTQGSPEWHAHRAQHRNASDAPAVMGCSPYKTRAELLREMHTGMAADVSASTQRIFDAGHRFEALARPVAEQIIGDDLYPCVGVEGRYSASFDGLTLGGETAWEHKTLNDSLRAAISQQGGNANDFLAPHYRAQLEHQCMVSGAERVLFMASRWADDGELLEERHCWYTPDAELRTQIIAGWEQLDRDLATYVPPAAAEPAPVGRAPDTLPALRIEVTGAVTASNLADFKATALAAIRSVNRDLKTDADFADADKAVKWCADVESRLKAAKEHALSQTADIDALFKALDDIGKEAREVRLDLGKLVDRRKVERKEEAVSAARRELEQHVAALNGELAPMVLRLQPVDFAGAIKGLRSFASMDDALSVAVANGKIAADAQARLIRANVAAITAKADGLAFLFSDLDQLVNKARDDFDVLVDARIAKHQADEAAREAKRQAEEAERIAAAERRAAAEAEARVRAEQEALARREREAEWERRRADAEADARMRADAAQQARQIDDAMRIAADRQAYIAQLGAPARHPDELATLRLGTICERLGFTVTAAFLADTLHVKHSATDNAARLYRESDWPVICRQLIAHISAASEIHERASEAA